MFSVIEPKMDDMLITQEGAAFFRSGTRALVSSTGAVTLMRNVCSKSAALTKFNRVDFGAYPALFMSKSIPSSSAMSSILDANLVNESKSVTSENEFGD